MIELPTGEAPEYLVPTEAPAAGAAAYTGEGTLEDAGGSGVADVAKQKATEVAQTAQEQAKAVVSEAGGQAKDLLAQARTEATEQAGVQQQRLAAGLRALGAELRSMAEHSGTPGVATDLARQGADKSEDVAAWLEGREPGAVVEEVRHFARRRTGGFLLAAAGAGLLAGRLTRGVKDANGVDSEAGR